MKLHQWIGLTSCLLAFAGIAVAQDVFGPPPQYSTLPPGLQLAQTNQQMEAFQPAGVLPNAPLEPPLVQWGPVGLRPHAMYRFLYGTGIRTSTNSQTASVVQRVSPGLLVTVGSHLTLDYTPSWNFYSSREFKDSLDHEAQLNFGAATASWVFGLSQSYISESLNLIETAEQTKQDIYTTHFLATHTVSRNVSLELTLNQTIREVPQFVSSKEWSTLDWVDYQFWPGMSAGLGVGGGYVEVDQGSNQSYEQLQARVRWRATDKLSLEVHGGGENRQFISAGTGDRISPVLGLAVSYLPVETTSLTLTANRGSSPSYTEDEFTETTGVSGILNQRLFRHLYLRLGAGYRITEYLSSTAGAAAGRRDESYTLGARLSTTFLRRGTVAIFYQYSDNFSNRPGFGYTSNQGGVEVGFHY